jgi:hypothetical protein
VLGHPLISLSHRSACRSDQRRIKWEYESVSDEVEITASCTHWFMSKCDEVRDL